MWQSYRSQLVLNGHFTFSRSVKVAHLILVQEALKAFVRVRVLAREIFMMKIILEDLRNDISDIQEKLRFDIQRIKNGEVLHINQNYTILLKENTNFNLFNRYVHLSLGILLSPLHR